jgi:hypothetical protein
MKEEKKRDLIESKERGRGKRFDRKQRNRKSKDI